MKHFLLSFIFLCCCYFSASAQDKTVTGTVISGEDNTPLPGVNVLVKGTNSGSVTDIDGKYRISLSSDANTIVFSYIGFLSQEIEVGSSSVIDITMIQDDEVLQEIVVNALGFETDRDKSAAASTTVGGERLLDSGEPNLINSLGGKSSGINIVQNSGEPGAGSRIVLRGATSITGDIQPLIVIDGVPMFNDTYLGEAFGGNETSAGVGTNGGVAQQSRLNDINPADIESVEVLKGAAASAVWGSRGANGVLVITTKKGSSKKGGGFTVNFSSSISIDEINQKVPLNTTYGKGSGMLAAGGTSRSRTSWGDRIADRPGGENDWITDPNDENYAGFFETSDGRRYYNYLAGTPEDPNGGINSREVYDIYDPIFKTGTTLTNTIDVGSSDENGSIFASLSYLTQDGIIRENSTYDRINARTNFTRYLGKIFTLNANVGFTNTSGNRVQMGSNLSGLFLGGLRNSPDFNLNDYVGTYVDNANIRFENRQRSYRNPLGASTSSIYDNPLWLMRNILSTTVVNRFMGKIELQADPTDWLNLTSRLGYDTYTDEREDIFPFISSNWPGGHFSKETITRSQYNFDFIARGKFSLNDGNIGINPLLGVNLNQRKFDDSGSITRNWNNSDSPPQLSNGSLGSFIPFNLEETQRILGFYGGVNVSLFDQVFIGATGRFDGWSTFANPNEGDEGEFFFYGGADVAWQFSKLIPENDYLTFGKLRLAYGKVGRGPDPYLTAIDFINPTGNDRGYGDGFGPGLNGGAYNGGVARSVTAPNPDIKPEVKTEFEIGADLRLWKDKIDLGVTYYSNETKDLIVQTDAAVSSGFRFEIQNAATVENKGIEVELGAEILNINDFTWIFNGNFSRNRSEVTQMAEGVNSITLAGFTGTSSRAVLGEQMGALWGSRFDRDANGEIILDEDGFPDGLADIDGVIGDPNPDYRMGLGSTLKWKNLSLNFLFDFSIGGDMWNGTKGALAVMGTADYTTETTTLTADQANQLRIVGGETVAGAYGQVGLNSDGSYTLRGRIHDFGGGEVFLDESWDTGLGGGFSGADELFIEDAGWTRLRELSLGYTFNSASFREKTKLSSLNLSFTGRNLILWTDYSGVDPDTNLTGSAINGLGLDYFNNPATRSYIFTLRLTY
ncbi:MAG: SusC/RagA family TonB-linked outer membrane protein [Bacteroidota bacterium]